MQSTIVRLAAILAMALQAAHAASAAELRLEEVFCEYRVNPLGVDTPHPRFSWVLGADGRGRRQTAYRLLVATSPEKLAADIGDKWDSGKVASERSANVVYAGSPLSSGETCYWKVRCWDSHDVPSDWSEPSTFEMGLLQESDWQSGWIGAGAELRYIPGRLEQAVTLDGTSQTIQAPHEAALKPAGGITLAAWVCPGDALGDAWREVYRKEDGSARHLLALGRTGNVRGLWVGLGIDGQYVEFGAATSLEQLKDGQWHLLAATYDGSQIRLYVDGAQIGSKPQTGALMTAGGAPAFIGSSGGSGEFFPGGIDDVRVYGRALSPAEISDLYAGASVSSAGLAGWWKLDGDLINSISGVAGVPRGGTGAAPLLRREFQLDKPVQRARAYMAGVGWSELYINGSKVGDHVLDPAATDYDKRILYVTHDVTEMLQPGVNVLGVMLGNGWFSEPGAPGYGDSPRLRLQMNIRFTDGTSASITSDPAWKVTEGPILRNDLFGGETYDARLDQAGWLLPGFDASGWQAAKVVEAPGGFMESQLMPAIKVVETIRPVALTNPAPGIYVYNMGQLFGGWARLRVKGPVGTRITLKYSPRVFAGSGLIDKTRHPEPKETDYYILKGDPAGEIYEPRFTFHPVWYVQVEGYPGTPTLDDLEGRVVHSAVDLTGDFECSNALFTQIHRNAVWTLRNELFGFPLDCLHREHWGWLEPGTNPSTLFARKHMPLFWDKFLNDARHAQHSDGVIPDVVPAYPLKGRTTGDPAWAGNYPLLVWYVYQYYDDRRIVEEHYASMKAWLEHLIAISADHLITTGYYGDHMLPGPAPGEEEFLSSETPPPLLWTGFYYRNASILAQAAELLGHADDAQRYAQLAGQIRDAINAKWFDAEAGRYATGSQTSNLMPLVLGIVPPGSERRVVASIAANIRDHDLHFHTGNLGTSCLMEVSLADRREGKLMYDVLNQTTYPGYGYMVAQGATTLWEAWGLRDDVGSGEESMDMWGSVDEFFYKDLAGIRGPDYFGPRTVAPGFREIEIKPHVLGNLTHARAHIRTMRGRVSSHWRIENDVFTLEVEIPVNSTARVGVPLFGATGATVKESNRPVWDGTAFLPGADGITAASRDGDYIVFQIGSGTYSFSVPVPLSRRADLDQDGDVDGDDVSWIDDCRTGPMAGPPAVHCEVADLDGDDDVDQSDFGLLQRCLSGPGIAPDVNCAVTGHNAGRMIAVQKASPSLSDFELT